MFHFLKRKFGSFFKFINCLLIFVFAWITSSPVWAQNFLNLPAPGTMVTTSANFIPPVLKGIKVYPNIPFRFDFIIDTGDSSIQGEQIKKEAERLIKYFLAALTVPEGNVWVNLSPYEENRIISEKFGTTEMGRDLLAQDYILKQLTASLIYPEDELGKKFWNKVYKKVFEIYGTTNIPINTFNKVWIIPDKAGIYENKDVAFVVEAHLKVMLEEDYLALNENLDSEQIGTDKLEEDKVKQLSNVSSQIVREVIIPMIEKEVNEGKNFLQLRQIYNSLILAAWYRKTLKESLLGKSYMDKNKVVGIDIDDKESKQKIYGQYIEAFKLGVYDYIREDYDLHTRQSIPRKYFSGGFALGENFTTKTLNSNYTFAQAISSIANKLLQYVQVRIQPVLKREQKLAFGYIIGEELGEKERKEWEEQIRQRSNLVRSENENIIQESQSRCKNVLTKYERILDEELKKKGVEEDEISRVFQSLRNPIKEFNWFEAWRYIKGKEKYYLGGENALAVDIIRDLRIEEEKGKYKDLIEEYILHEALERTSLNHHEIIRITNEIFGRPPIKGKLYGQTPLGGFLHSFIQSKEKQVQVRSPFKSIHPDSPINYFLEVLVNSWDKVQFKPIPGIKNTDFTFTPIDLKGKDRVLKDIFEEHYTGKHKPNDVGIYSYKHYPIALGLRLRDDEILFVELVGFLVNDNRELFGNEYQQKQTVKEKISTLFRLFYKAGITLRKKDPDYVAIERGWTMPGVTTIPIFSKVFRNFSFAKILIETILNRIKPGEKGLDMGSGSGIIAVELAKKGAMMHAIDINPLAVGNTNASAAVAGVLDKVRARQSNAFENVSDKYDFIICCAPAVVSEGKVIDKRKVDVATTDIEGKFMNSVLSGLSYHLRKNGRFYLVTIYTTELEDLLGRYKEVLDIRILYNANLPVSNRSVFEISVKDTPGKTNTTVSSQVVVKKSINDQNSGGIDFALDKIDIDVAGESAGLRYHSMDTGKFENIEFDGVDIDILKVIPFPSENLSSFLGQTA